jgi:hypothetical protein
MFEVGIDSLLVAIREHPRMLELADMICAGDSDILHTHIEWKIGMFEMLLREGVAEGLWRVDDPPALAETLLDATRSFWTPMSVAYLDPAGVPDRVQGVLDVILAGIRA